MNAKGHPFWIMTEPYKSKVSEDGSTSTIFDTGVTNNGADYGTVTFTVPTTGAPDTLYYQCGNHDAMYGILQIRDVVSTTTINVEDDIIGVKNYSLRTLDLSNGMKIKFTNSLVPSAYQNKEYYVEGVGDSITLTDVEDLITPGSYATESTILYDQVGYDSRPYAKAYHQRERIVAVPLPGGCELRGLQIKLARKASLQIKLARARGLSFLSLDLSLSMNKTNSHHFSLKEV